MKPLILISNDDSVFAKGIQTIVEIAKEFGEVVVVAPDSPQSAKSHAVTLTAPIYYEKTSVFGNIEAYKCSGTPADSVKMALFKILDKKPDLLISGINHGANYSTNLIYSGTLAAAIEGFMHNIPSIAFSVDSHDPDADFSIAEKYSRKIIKEVLEKNTEVCLNVNFPDIKLDEINGSKICRQTKGSWAENFVEMKHPRSQEPFYWLTGNYINKEPEKTDTDVWAVENNYVAIVPIQIDFTNYKMMKEMESWNL